jgi:hypothetical protein
MFYQQPSQAINEIQATALLYTNINLLIDRHDYKRWEKRLNQSPDFQKELTESATFNLLNLLSTVNIERRYPAVLRLGTPVAENLEQWLSNFPALLKDDIFRGKIKNLDRDNFLSTLSELIVAAEFHRLGFAAAFEHRFNIPAIKGNRDVDLTITMNNGEIVHIEVYGPYMPANDGFSDFKADNNAFSKKVAFKMDDKFGPGEVVGLKGKVLLAVDTEKVDAFRVQRLLTGTVNDQLYLKMAAYLPQAVDGYLFFRGNIAAIPSFVFEKIILKK